MQNQNWFNAMITFFNTTKAVINYFDVSRAVAHDIQTLTAKYQSQAISTRYAKASWVLRNQIGN